MTEEKFIETIEGITRLLVPPESLTQRVPPKSPAFFNPLAKVNRNLSIMAYKAFIQDMNSDTTFADALCGVGARGLRVAVEVPGVRQIYLNDINPIAINCAKKSADLNHIIGLCNFSTEDTCKFLVEHSIRNGERFTMIDLDPFGSPSTYIDCLLRAVQDEGLVSVTATDTAVLSGVHPEVCFRRYYGRPLNNQFSNETAVRILMSLIALTASRLGLAIHPLFVHVNLNYIRIYAKIAASHSKANKVQQNIGYIQYCYKCGNRNTVREIGRSEVCNICGGSFKLSGLLWIEKLFDKEFIEKMSKYATNNYASNRRNNLEHLLLRICIDEIDDIPYYFRSDEVASKLKKNSFPLLTIIDKLSTAGYRASKTSLNAGAFKTDATIDQILKILD